MFMDVFIWVYVYLHFYVYTAKRHFLLLFLSFSGRILMSVRFLSLYLSLSLFLSSSDMVFCCSVTQRYSGEKIYINIHRTSAEEQKRKKGRPATQECFCFFFFLFFNCSNASVVISHLSISIYLLLSRSLSFFFFHFTSFLWVLYKKIMQWMRCLLMMMMFMGKRRRDETFSRHTHTQNEYPNWTDSEWIHPHFW